MLSHDYIILNKVSVLFHLNKTDTRKKQLTQYSEKESTHFDLRVSGHFVFKNPTCELTTRSHI